MQNNHEAIVKTALRDIASVDCQVQQAKTVADLDRFRRQVQEFASRAPENAWVKARAHLVYARINVAETVLLAKRRFG